MKNYTACFTGHRIIPLFERATVSKILENAVIESIENGYRYFGAGGALGFDTMAALTVLRLRNKYPQIKLILVLPCENQTRNWKAVDIEKYEHIKSQADKVVKTSIEYTPGCMHKRNRHLVDNSSLCICYLKKPSGGTVYTVNYAKDNRLKVIIFLIQRLNNRMIIGFHTFWVK